MGQEINNDFIHLILSTLKLISLTSLAVFIKKNK